MSVPSQTSATSGEMSAVRNVIHSNIVSSQASVASPAPSFAACPKIDSTRFGLVKFGMERSPHQGCCITRFTGGKSGCCAGLKSGKPFDTAYIKSVEKEIQKTGAMPELKPAVVEKLKSMKESEISEYERLQAMAKAQAKIAAKAVTPKAKVEDSKLSGSDVVLLKFKNKLVAIVKAPFRWIKWLAIGLWADLKRIFSGRRS
jgi:hypothetical protein